MSYILKVLDLWGYLENIVGKRRWNDYLRRYWGLLLVI